MSEARFVGDSKVVMTEIVLPTHTNSLGSAFGGVIMSWIDIAGAIAAQRHARSSVVTASIDDLHFVAPVFKGWIVNLNASVNRVFNSSMEVGVRVDAENPITGERFHTATAYLTFVALDSNSKPFKVVPVVAKTEDEKRRFDQAQERRELRLRRKALAKQLK